MSNTPVRSQGIVLRPEPDGSVKHKYWRFTDDYGPPEPNHVSPSHLVTVSITGDPSPAYTFYIQVLHSPLTIRDWKIEFQKHNGKFISPFSQETAENLARGSAEKNSLRRTRIIRGIGPNLIVIGGHYDTDESFRSEIVELVTRAYSYKITWTATDEGGKDKEYCWPCDLTGGPEMEVNADPGDPQHE